MQVLHQFVPNSDKAKVLLPLEGLINLLQAHGFHIQPEDYLEILSSVQQVKTKNLPELKYRLCPLVVTSPEEQERFYQVFDKYVQLQSFDESPIKQSKKITKSLIIISTFICLSIVVFFLFKYPRKSTDFPKYSATFNLSGKQSNRKSPYHALTGDTLLLDATKLFPREVDTINARISWNFGHDWEYVNQLKLYYPAIHGLIRLRVESGDQKKYINIDSQHIRICNKILDSLRVEFIVKQEKTESTISPITALIGDSVLLTPIFRGDSAKNNGNWIINETIYNKTANTLKYKFNKEGPVNITYRIGQQEDYQYSTRHFFIKQPKHRLFLQVFQNGRSATSIKKSIVPWILWTLHLFPIISGLFVYWLFKRNKRAAQLENIRKEEHFDKCKPYRPPYEVPMENKSLQQVIRENNQNIIFTAMRRKVKDDYRILDIQKSISEIIKSGGIPFLAFTNRMKQQQYLILIDESKIKSQELNLFKYLVNLLIEEDIFIEYFYYTTFDHFYSENFSSGFSLQQLAELYHSSTLIIFGNAHQLLYYAYPVIQKEKEELLERWENKAILTPECYQDWGIREEALKKHYIILPADIQGQLQLMQAIRENQLRNDQYLSAINEWDKTELYHFSEVDDLKDYLSDEDLFQWLCAICVYPVIRWEVIITVGKTLLTAGNCLDKLNFTNLLKLVRIRWMQEGVYPDDTRLALLKELTISNELLAREAIHSILEYSTFLEDGTHFFEFEKEQQLVTSEFILFLNSNDTKYKSGYQRFIDLWQNNKVLDAPLVHYLDKNDDEDYLTPLIYNYKNVGVTEYLKKLKDDKSVEIRKAKKVQLIRYACVPLLLLVACLYLIWVSDRIAQTQLAKKIGILSTNASTPPPISFSLYTNDSCLQVSRIFNYPVNGVLITNSRTYPLKFYNGKTEKLNLSYSDIQNPMKLRLIMDDTTWIWNSAIHITKENINLRLGGFCNSASIIKKQINISYNNISLLPEVRQLERALSNRYQVSTLLQKFSDSSNVLYFSNADEQLAQTLTVAILNITGKKLIPQLSRKSTSDPAFVTIHLRDDNTSSTCTPANMDNLPQELNDIWEYDNNLIRIDFQKRVIYSTKDNNSFNTQLINEVCTQENTFRIITNESLKYKLMQIASDGQGNFEIADCNNLYNTKEESKEKGIINCVNFSKLTPHLPNYQNNDTLIHFVLNTDGIKRLPQIAETYKRSDIDKITATVHMYKNENVNKKKLINSGINAFIAQLEKLNIQTFVNFDTVIQNPFLQSYISVQIRRILPDCSRTYYSIEEANKLGNPMLVCRLDLSKSKTKIWGKELYIYKNLKRLTLKRELTSDSEVSALKQVLPNCIISIIGNEKETQLGTLTIDDQGNPDYKSKQIIKDVAAKLKAYPNAKIKLVGLYYNEKSSTKINRGIKIINVLFHRAGLSVNTQQIEQEIYFVQHAIQSNYTINIIGINVP
ncbi:hypothetical protein [Chitinophaga tropicalis]|uniref:Uncharacterized protein n=1 Tax=Chitinophaga tropicalis TaxID=2683588 RepID=A0A7K1U7G4_9BACT|nr:hypothetical protein [Chitinophaga tropicalis]MVT10289.1 hypothetical protein [Chitinophaga tropicalis]